MVNENLDLKNVDVAYTYLVDNGYFTDEELNLVTSINGYDIETIENCIYARYGYRSLEQMLEEEDNVNNSEDR